MSVWNWASTGVFVHTLDGMILTAKAEGHGVKPFREPQCAPQILHGLTWARTQYSAVPSRLSYVMAHFVGWLLIFRRIYLMLLMHVVLKI
jgi:hypothetical protein